MSKAILREEIRLARVSPEYWRVTFDHPPLNIFGPANIPPLEESVSSLETDASVKVVAFGAQTDVFFRECLSARARCNPPCISSSDGPRRTKRLQSDASLAIELLWAQSQCRPRAPGA